MLQLRVAVHLRGLISAPSLLALSYRIVGCHHQVVSIVLHVNQESWGCRTKLRPCVTEPTSFWLNRVHSLWGSTHKVEPRGSKWRSIHWWTLWSWEGSSDRLQQSGYKCLDVVFLASLALRGERHFLPTCSRMRQLKHLPEVFRICLRASRLVTARQSTEQCDCWQ